MKLEIENIRLVDTISVLEKMSLKGMKSIHRTRLAKALAEKLKRVAEEEQELRKEHCNLDDEGNPIIKDKKYDIIDMEAYQKAMGEFFRDKVVIDGGDSQVFLKSVKKSLEESEDEWEGKEAYIFEGLYEGFKGDEKADEE